jgi:hypothetical protein
LTTMTAYVGSSVWMIIGIHSDQRRIQDFLTGGAV